MAGGWRVTARTAAAAMAAAAAPRAPDSVRRRLTEPIRPQLGPAPPSPADSDRVVVAAQTQPPHEFGPAPIVAPSHGIGFRSVPRHIGPAAETPVANRNEEEHEPDDAPPPRHAASVRLVAPPLDDISVARTDTADAAQTAIRPGRHRREHSAISGTVRSTRGRGLRDMQVVVLDEHWQVVATAVTGTGGAFVAEELPPGAYRVMATDELDGDFGAGWHDSSSHPKAGILQVKEGRTRRNVDITVASSATIDVEIEVRRKKAVVGIRVTERATGVRAGGSVRISTKRFGAELPLTKGRTAITLLGSADGSPRLSKKVKVDYLGTKHVRPASTSAKLR
jgi:hypothetical protein